MSKDRILNCEFKALLDKLQEYNINKEINQDVFLVNKAELTSVRVKRFISNMLIEDWKENSMMKWRKLRELVLRFPTMSEHEFLNDIMASNFYVQLPEKNNKLFYKQNDDYNNIIIRFEQNKEINYEVSECSAKLNIFMSNPAIKDFLNKRAGQLNLKRTLILCLQHCLIIYTRVHWEKLLVNFCWRKF